MHEHEMPALQMAKRTAKAMATVAEATSRKLNARRRDPEKDQSGDMFPGSSVLARTPKRVADAPFKLSDIKHDAPKDDMDGVPSVDQTQDDLRKAESLEKIGVPRNLALGAVVEQDKENRDKVKAEAIDASLSPREKRMKIRAEKARAEAKRAAMEAMKEAKEAAEMKMAAARLAVMSNENAIAAREAGLDKLVAMTGPGTGASGASGGTGASGASGATGAEERLVEARQKAFAKAQRVSKKNALIAEKLENRTTGHSGSVMGGDVKTPVNMNLADDMAARVQKTVREKVRERAMENRLKVLEMAIATGQSVTGMTGPIETGSTGSTAASGSTGASASTGPTRHGTMTTGSTGASGMSGMTGPQAASMAEGGILVLKHGASGPTAVTGPTGMSAVRQQLRKHVKKDCIVSEWSEWGNCSRQCGAGQQKRHRIAVVQPTLGRPVCPALVESRPCDFGPCNEQQCKTTKWSAWSECSRPCDGGWQKRTRKLLLKDAICEKHMSEIRKCNTKHCTLHKAVKILKQAVDTLKGAFPEPPRIFEDHHVKALRAVGAHD
jgi:hypothetical protein